MASEKIVLDASVVAKWYLKEKYSEQALKLRDDYISGQKIIAAPVLLEYEVLNVLKYSGVYDEREMMEIANSINKYGFEWWRLGEELKSETIRLSVKYNITVYDAAYLALAAFIKAPFYTADEELLNKVAELKIGKHIKDY